MTKPNPRTGFWPAFGITIAVCFVIAAAILIGTAGCTADQLAKAEKTGQYVATASTQPSPTDALPYGLLVKWTAGAIGLGVVEIARRWRKSKAAADTATTAVRQIVAGVEAVLPEKTDQQKLQLAAAQDEATKALVDQVKPIK